MSDHEISIKPAYDIFTLTSGYKGTCSCGWSGSFAIEADYAMASARLHLKFALNSEYGKHTNERYGKLAQEKHASPATADWHVTLKSPHGNTYTLIGDGLAEAIDYAHTMRFEFGWELLDFHREG